MGRRMVTALVAGALAACGGSGTGSEAGADSGTDPGVADASGPGAGRDGGGDGGGDGGTVWPDDPLEVAEGCAGVFNPEQVLDYHLELADADWQTVLGDTSNSTFVPADLRCGDEPPITIGVRRKRSGGTEKVGLKLDINQFVAGQRYHDLRKLSFENGVSEGTTQDGAGIGVYVTEYLAWRLMSQAGAHSGRAALARLTVNGNPLGVYVNVEQVDKRYLKARLGNDGGWLYKHSGSTRDGFKTHETDGLDDPYDDYFCFFVRGGGSCPPPSDEVLAVELPEKLDIPQMLRVGAVNAYIANTDSPLFKDNNYYWYDWAGGGRVYLPWDLDSVMNADVDVLTGGVGGQTTIYTDVLFTHWEDDYRAILGELAADTLPLELILAELDRVDEVAAAALDGDPYATGSTADATASLRAWWTDRHAAVVARLGL